jgi:hypothetical protein
VSTGFDLPMVAPAATTTARDRDWHRAARMALILSWASLF